MAATATVTLNGSITGLPTGAVSIGTLTASSANSNGGVQQVVLGSGNNTFIIPTAPAPSGVIVQLPATNTSVVTFKGVTGDTGIAIGKTGWFVIPFDPTAVPNSFVLSSVSAQTGKYTYVTYF